MKILLPDYDWTAYILFDDFQNAMMLLRSMGASHAKVEEIREFLEGENTGISATNEQMRMSVAIIGRSTDASQIVNTLVHEITHVATHICQALEVATAENIAYLAGDIAEEVYSEFGCPCDMVKKDSRRS